MTAVQRLKKCINLKKYERLHKLDVSTGKMQDNFLHASTYSTLLFSFDFIFKKDPFLSLFIGFYIIFPTL